MWKIFRRRDYRLTCDELYRLRVYHEKLWHANGDLAALSKKEAEDLGRLIRKRNKEVETHATTR